jgi:hypothetical protein
VKKENDMARRILILGLMLVVAGAASAADPWTVVLGDGTTHLGALVRLSQGRYLLQTDTALLELVDDDIDPRTFAERPRREAQPKKPVAEARTFAELHVDGTVTTSWKHLFHNDHSHAITEFRYGLAPWEQREIDQRALFDDFGNELALAFDPPREKWKAGWDKRVQVAAALPVPVAPGEDWTISGRRTATGAIRQHDEGWIYTNVGDYAEDRLVWLKVALPQGATLVRATPEPSARFDDGGREYVMWRQFYRKGERRPLQIVYKLD